MKVLKKTLQTCIAVVLNIVSIKKKERRWKTLRKKRKIFKRKTKSSHLLLLTFSCCKTKTKKILTLIIFGTLAYVSADVELFDIKQLAFIIIPCPLSDNALLSSDPQPTFSPRSLSFVHTGADDSVGEEKSSPYESERQDYSGDGRWRWKANFDVEKLPRHLVIIKFFSILKKAERWKTNRIFLRCTFFRSIFARADSVVTWNSSINLHKKSRLIYIKMRKEAFEREHNNRSWRAL